MQSHLLLTEDLESLDHIPSFQPAKALVKNKKNCICLSYPLVPRWVHWFGYTYLSAVATLGLQYHRLSKKLSVLYEEVVYFWLESRKKGSKYLEQAKYSNKIHKKNTYLEAVDLLTLTLQRLRINWLAHIKTGGFLYIFIRVLTRLCFGGFLAQLPPHYPP